MKDAVVVQDGKDIRYIMMELLPDSAIVKVDNKYETGLFAGMDYIENKKIKTDGKPTIDTMIVLKKNNETVSLDMDFYNILSIKTYDGKSTDLLLFKDSVEDQELAMLYIDEYLTEMAKAGKMTNNPNVIDTERYTDIPKDYNTIVTSHNVTSSKSCSSVYSKGSSTTTYTKPAETVVKTVTPLLIKRLKPPVPGNLDQMKELVAQIRAKTYTAPVLPVIEKETEEDKKPSTTTTTSKTYSAYADYSDYTTDNYMC